MSETDSLKEKWLASQGNPNTLRVYRRAVAKFAIWSDKKDVVRLLTGAGADAATVLVKRWREDLRLTHKRNTVANYVSAICSLVNAARDSGLIPWRLERVAPPAERGEDVEVLSIEEMQAIAAMLDKRFEEENAKSRDSNAKVAKRAEREARMAARDAAIVSLLYPCAMSRGETGLDVEHVQVDQNGGTVVLVKRKCCEARVAVLLSEKATGRVRRHMRLRGEAPGPLFHQLVRELPTEKPLSGESVRRLLDKRRKEAGIRRRVRPRDCRRSAIMQVGRLGGSLDVSMAVAGLRSASSMKSYTDSRDDDRKRGIGMLEH